MKPIQLSRRFLKNPVPAIVLLLLLAVGSEAFSWLLDHRQKMSIIKQFGGGFAYSWIVLRGMILPEVLTIIIITALLNACHRWFNVKTIRFNWLSVSLYEASFLPVLLLAFVIFNPFTQTLRYGLLNFPNFSFSDFWHDYLINTFTWSVYLLYLLPVLLIGYLLLNLSLVSDLRKRLLEV